MTESDNNPEVIQTAVAIEVQSPIPINCSTNNLENIFEITLYDQHIILNSKRCRVIIGFSCIDCLVNILYFFYNSFFALAVFCSFYGLYGAKKCHTCSLKIYFGYNSISAISKFGIILFNKKYTFIILTLISAIIDLYVARLTYVLTYHLSNLTVEQRMQIKTLNSRLCVNINNI